VKLDVVAVVFDFVNSLRALGSLALQGGKLGFNEPRHLNTLNHRRNSQKDLAAPQGERSDEVERKPREVTSLQSPGNVRVPTAPADTLGLSRK